MCDNPFHFIRYHLIFFELDYEELVSLEISQSRNFSIYVSGLT
jgi:hypothetical protein